MKKQSIVLVLLLAPFLVSCGPKHNHGGTPGKTAPAAAQYHCPMHPTYTSDKPGDCPICNMKLVPIQDSKPTSAKYDCPMKCEGAASDKPGNCPKCGMTLEPVAPEYSSHEPAIAAGRVAIHVAPERQQTIGLVTATVGKRRLTETIRTVGRVGYAEPRAAALNAKFGGYVETLHVDSTGQFVKAGEPLAEVYSPEIVSAQEEYLIAFRAKQQETPGSESLFNAARRRLQLLDITEAQIRKLEESGKASRILTIVSPFDGFVIEKDAVAGKSFTAGENLYRVADLSKVWVYADIYELDLPRVKPGQAATVTVASLPGESFQGSLDYVYPTLEESTRTVRARIEAGNAEFRLKPNMWADVVIEVASAEALAIPSSAVIDTGKRRVAFVDKGGGHLEPREVTLGARTDEFVEVKSGVHENEKVVTRALFLIDSESQLRAAMYGMGGHEH